MKIATLTVEIHTPDTFTDEQNQAALEAGEFGSIAVAVRNVFTRDLRGQAVRVRVHEGDPTVAQEV